MKCRFCFATFLDLGKIPKHDFKKSAKLIQELAKAGFEKITFAGGEPTLIRELPELAALARKCGMVTTIVTNGSQLLKDSFFNKISPHLDWIALSIDSVEEETNLESGRAVRGKIALNSGEMLRLAKKIKAAGIKLKINTVVSRYNFLENLTRFINACEPDRWKILQAIPVKGQNCGNSGRFEISDEEFKDFLLRHNEVSEKVVQVPEREDQIRGSYAMISPEGKFMDNVDGELKYSSPILEVGVLSAFGQIRFDPEKFEERKGIYDW